MRKEEREIKRKKPTKKQENEVEGVGEVNKNSL